jgi:thiol-disulfide isomerase/thioredoxin
MSLTPSNMLPLGTQAPDFCLPSCQGGEVSLSAISLGKKAVVVMFLCNHCPFVQHIEPELCRLANDYAEQSVAFVAINANDVDAYPEDSMDNMRQRHADMGCPYPYLLDQSQEVAKAYQAACTPDFFIFDAHLACVYRGRLDDSRPGNNVPCTGQDLRAALDAVLHDRPVPKPQHPSMGCNIKWRGE